jgi:hypothetical protein
MPDASPLGLAHGKVALADSDDRWASLYQVAETVLRGAIGYLVLDIQHFGSTSIPGIKAKPILDILVALERFDDGGKLIGPLGALGYDYVGTEMVPNDHLFGLGSRGSTFFTQWSTAVITGRAISGSETACVPILSLPPDTKPSRSTWPPALPTTAPATRRPRMTSSTASRMHPDAPDCDGSA